MLSVMLTESSPAVSGKPEKERRQDIKGDPGSGQRAGAEERTINKTVKSGFDLLPHFPYSPDQASSDYQEFFPKLKKLR